MPTKEQKRVLITGAAGQIGTELTIALRERMGNELFKAAFEFYWNLYFYIDKKENKILDHMHWHARRNKL